MNRLENLLNAYQLIMGLLDIRQGEDYAEQVMETYHEPINIQWSPL